MMYMCLCVCVCVCEGERDCVCVCVCMPVNQSYLQTNVNTCLCEGMCER